MSHELNMTEMIFVVSGFGKSIDTIIAVLNSQQDFSLEKRHWNSIENSKYVPDELVSVDVKPQNLRVI